MSIAEHGNKPHQRDNPSKIIVAYPKHKAEVLNQIFDTGFNNEIDRRWQSATSLIEQLELLKMASASTSRNTAEIVQNIKKRMLGNNYEEVKFSRLLLEKVNAATVETLGEIKNELGSDWEISQSGGISNHGGVHYRNELPLANRVDPRLRTQTTVHSFFTGTELVIQVIEDKYKDERIAQIVNFSHTDKKELPKPKTIELLRTPIRGDIAWALYKTRLRDHYLSAIDDDIM